MWHWPPPALLKERTQPRAAVPQMRPQVEDVRTLLELLYFSTTASSYGARFILCGEPGAGVARPVVLLKLKT